MDKSDFYFNKLESILDKEQEALLQIRREHHSSWDSHILTLSTAAVGFSFTFLPLSGSEAFWLAIAGIFSFVLSIIFTTSNYIVADNGIELASKSHLARRIQQDKVLHRVNRLKREIENFKSEDEIHINAAREQCWNDIEKIYAERNSEKEIKDMTKNNNRVRFLNHAKTYAFLIGVIAITAFSLCNIDLLGK
jgi:hypothetical protein